MEIKIEETTPIILKNKCDRCPECKSTNLVHDYENGETVCGDCGLVLNQEMDTRKRVAYDSQQRKDRTQTGPPELITVHDKGLSTTVGYANESRDAGKKKISGNNILQFNRLKKWQTRSRVHNSEERNLVQAMQEISRMCDNLNVPQKSSVRVQAAAIYIKALKKRLIRGRSTNAIAAASVYYSCRITGVPKSLTEVAKRSLVDKKDTARCYRFLQKELNIQPPVSNPIIFISKIAETTGISGTTQGLAISLIRQAPKFQAGNNPEGSAAAALYIACLLNKERATQKDIAQAAGVTEVTIRNRYKVLARILHIKFPDN